MSLTSLVPAQVSSSTGPAATLLDQSASVTTQDKNPDWVTEVPLPTITTTTNPVLMATVSSVTKDGHTDDDGGGHHPVFFHPHCIVSIVMLLER